MGVAVGIAAWGAILLGRGADRITELAPGSAAAVGERPRELIEAASSGNLDQAVATLPSSGRESVASAAGEGFLAGFNEILVMGAGLALAGAVVALWLIREREIERRPVEAVVEAAR